MRIQNLASALALSGCAFVGGAASTQLARATSAEESPYALVQEFARALVLIDGEYVDPAERNKVLEGGIRGMVAELDPHSAYMNPSEYQQFQSETEGKFAGIGVEVDSREGVLTVVAPMEGSPAERAGIRPGDQIIAIDGRPVRGERLEKIVPMMRGNPGTKVKLGIRRGSRSGLLHFEIVRENIRVTSVTAKKLSSNIGYIRLSQFQEGTHEEFLRSVGKIKPQELVGIILDLRANPGGLVDEAEAVADEFLDLGTIYSTRHRGAIVDKAEARPGGALASLPVAILVNEYSASSAELLAGALQDNRRGTVIGSPTYGKGSVQTIFDLPNGAGLRLTTMRYYTPSGRSIQAAGITPDIRINRPEDPNAIVVLRERDLEGHLESEAAARDLTSRLTLIDTTAKSDDENPMPAREIPDDPTTGKDFALSVAYRTALGRSVP